MLRELGLMAEPVGQVGLAPLLHRPLVPTVPLLHVAWPALTKSVVKRRQRPMAAADAAGGTPVPGQVEAAVTAVSVTSADRLWHQKVGLAAGCKARACQHLAACLSSSHQGGHCLVYSVIHSLEMTRPRSSGVSEGHLGTHWEGPVPAVMASMPMVAQ